MRRRRTRLRDESGSELIEFAVVFPLLLTVVLGIVDFAMVFQRIEVLTNATREGARLAVLPGYDAADVEARVVDYLQAGGMSTTAGNPAVVVADTTITVNGTDVSASTVNVTFNHDYLFLDDVASWFGGSFGSVDLRTEATMRNEIASGG